MVPTCSLTNVFQSTLPRRERLHRLNYSLHHLLISIHSPTKGAATLSNLPGQSSRFQSTLPRRERLIICGFCSDFNLFQSTLPRRERRYRQRSAGFCLQNFNPRSHEGSDVTVGLACPITSYFNPRSHEGSDPTKILKCGCNFRFQSTLPRRERHD